MRNLAQNAGELPSRYDLFPGALLHDLQLVWRQRSRQSGDARYKSIFERAYADRHTTIAEKTFRNWINGTTQIDRRKAQALLTVMLENWTDDMDKTLCVCPLLRREETRPASCALHCDQFQKCRENILDKIFSFNGRPQDQISILPAPGYSSEAVCRHYAEKGHDILFPVDTAHAHSWDEEHFFSSFSMLELFIRHRNMEKRPRFVYLMRPFALSYLDARSRQRATGEAIYRAAFERLARNNPEIGRAEFSDAVKFLVKTEGREELDASGYRVPEDLIMPTRLADSLPAQSPARLAALQMDKYIHKQMRIHGAKDYQFLAATSDGGTITYYLTCIPERREEGKWIAARYPLLPLRSLIPGLDEPVKKLLSAAGESPGTLSGWKVLTFEEFLALPSQRAFNLH